MFINTATSTPAWTEWINPKTDEKYSLSLVQSGNLVVEDLEACFGLVEETSRPDYEASTIGWKPGKKLAEMKSPELRYILVKDNAGSLRGFTSLMPTYEEGEPVVYCYEIHLKPELHGYDHRLVYYANQLSLSFSFSFSLLSSSLIHTL